MTRVFTKEEMEGLEANAKAFAERVNARIKQNEVNAIACRVGGHIFEGYLEHQGLPWKYYDGGKLRCTRCGCIVEKVTGYLNDAKTH